MFDLIKGTENLEKLNSGGLNENYDYLENDCNLKEKSELFLKELNITEEELNEEAINYHNTFTNIEIKKERLNNEYLNKVNDLKEELNKSINNLNNEFNINQNSFNNINNIFKIISVSQDNINKYNCEVNTIEKFIKTIQKNINFVKDNENKKNNKKKNNEIFTKDMELTELQNINESIFINLENKIKNNFSNNLRFIMFNKIIVYLENQKKNVNENIIKEQININKITYFLMKNKWFEKAKSVDTKINYIIESIKKITYTQNVVDDNCNINCLNNKEDDINFLNNDEDNINFLNYKYY